MDVVRKLFFAPFFLFSLVVMLIFADQLLVDPLSAIFGFTATSAFTLLYLVAALLLTGFFYILFVSLSQDWRLVLPVGILAALIPFGLFTSLELGLYLAGGITIAMLVGFFSQIQKMKSYVTFSAVELLKPQIKMINLFLILSLSLSYYLIASTQIKEKGFSIPEPLIEAAVKMSGQQDQMNEVNGENPTPAMPQLSPGLIAQLKQNPAVLAQYGITPAQLDALSAASQKKSDSSGESLVSGLIKSQVDKVVEPYKEWIAPLMAIVFFFSLSSLHSFLALLLTPLIGLIFMLLEKSNFIHFEKEMREVKKLVV